MLERFRFEGIEALTDEELESFMLSRSASMKPWISDPRYDEFLVEEDLERLVDAYRANGYYEAEITTSTEWNEEHTRATVVFHVAEGEPVLLESLEVAWNPEAPVDASLVADLESRFRLVPGAIFSLATYRETRETLLAGLADAGRPAALLEGSANLDLDTSRARVAWRIDPGPEITLGAITLTGLSRVAESLVRRELLIAEGERYARDALLATERAIYALGLFRTVAVRASAPAAGSDTWPVEIVVEERSPRTLRVGVGYGTEDEFRGQVSYSHRNFLGRARRLGITGKASSLVLGVDTRITQPRFPDALTEATIYTSFLHETPPAYDSDLVLAGVGFERPLGGPWLGFAGYRFEWGDVTNTTVASNRVTGETLLSFFRIGVRRDTLDDSLNPSAGTWFEFSVEPAGTAIGSDVDYVRMRAEVRAFAPLGFLVAAARVRAGTLQPFAGSGRTDVPAFKLFYSGGSNSVRGFKYQHLGPLDAQGQPEGGLTLGEANFELRFPIWRSLSGVAFVDAGQVSSDPFDLRIGEFLASAGGGLRLRTPVGSVRLDYGRLLNRPPGVDSGRFYISIGQAF